MAAATCLALAPLGTVAAPADGVATFTDAAAFDAALSALGTVTSIVATYDDLTAGAVLPDGTAVSGITHDYTGGSDADVDLFIRDFPDGGTQTLGTLFEASFEGAFGFDDAVTFSVTQGYRAVSLDLLNSPTFDFLATDVNLAAGGSTLDVDPGAGSGIPVATGVERRFFGIIAGAATIDIATLSFDAPGTAIGDVDNVSFYNVEGKTPPPPPIPLPAALPLLLGAIGALAALTRHSARRSHA